MPSLPRPNLTIASLLALFTHLLLPQTPATAVQVCGIVSCPGSPTNDLSLSPPLVQFPFWLNRQRQSPRCGYQGFDLSCTPGGDTLLQLPSSGEFSVKSINYYSTQSITLADPDGCFPRRLLGNFSLTGSAFRPLIPRRFTFLNCSYGADRSSGTSQGMPATLVPCLSEGNYTVMSVPTRYYSEGSYPCEELATVVVPLPWPFWSDVEDVISLTWDVPDCGSCRKRGGLCGYKSVNGTEVGCSNVPGTGLPRSAKYGVVLGVGIPGLLCVIGLASFVFGKIKAHRRPTRPNAADVSNLIAAQSVTISMGLDRPTIESYPKTQLGESRRLPEPNDITCPICLCEYQPKETLRSIPDCNHYFHVDCIDEWLRLNGTCPLCRNSPEDPS
ncbi:putative RING-H2 finger protein ATL21A [Rhodamnia argentea]|uniref:RING-type E3 ubiquitin transferase n=1 Tax=Rhodamnia argentea TaxID=178133 RepID=A0A8B8P907_9MYRT|nr:putative RING-H2 finger protein ATL21A [Rhodamnia argentea]